MFGIDTKKKYCIKFEVLYKNGIERIYRTNYSENLKDIQRLARDFCDMIQDTYQHGVAGQITIQDHIINMQATAEIHLSICDKWGNVVDF